MSLLCVKAYYESWVKLLGLLLAISKTMRKVKD